MTRRAVLAFVPASSGFAAGSIDRRALVRRQNPVLTRFDPRSPLTVGNGELAFTADVTGLETFPELYERDIPLCTQSQWGWHSFPAPKGLAPDSLRLAPYDTWGRQVGYATRADGQEELYNWLRQNPHRLHLGRIALVLTTRDGAAARPSDLAGIRQELDLWTGILLSRFQLGGVPVTVETCCHPAADVIAVRLRSALLQQGQLAVAFEFPYGSPDLPAADWLRPAAHRSVVAAQTPQSVEILRELDADAYVAGISWERDAALARQGPHRFVLRPAGAELRFVCAFSARRPAPRAPDAFAACAHHWPRFWSQGAALELAGTPDPRAGELERRVVLSQYLTAIQCAGSMPPQETGLTCNSWYGKFHLEMHWWHAAHFALWGRTPLLERSLGWYRSILPAAREKAKQQGYRGARWPKMVGPEGRDSPSPVGPLLIWQQPHIIAFAELCWRAHPDQETLERFRDLVFESADFMASYAVFDRGRFVLGPPVIPAQENHPPRETWNPTFELEYWAHGLAMAQQWRRRLKLDPDPAWERVRAGLSALPVKDGVYLAHENCPQTYTERNRDHPSMLAALGVLPGARVDRPTMRRTLHQVLDCWRWPDTWGWDYPMVAMTAARLDEPERAIDALLMDTPKNRWLPNGHNWQRPNLPLYLPANGGLLAAVALMAAGWPGAPRRPHPGFPAHWAVRQQGLQAYL